ncbi:hypothetical protein RchiOBHm_Chr5g0031111 [Rosa chinensis]|uniref:Uncharacterized protein n=1 Tax=Rosa chinensis TaxID=74649 RepID=A0A2P6QA42_ROSCH|nr:hypothetical protein RchiOBHm_Chr5g0031111 [Rosa chinensis]
MVAYGFLFCSKVTLMISILGLNRTMRAVLIDWLVEVSVPLEALQPLWTSMNRKSWGRKLHSSSSAEDLLQWAVKARKSYSQNDIDEVCIEVADYIQSLVGCGSFGLCKDNQCVACPSSNGLLGWSETCAPEKLTSCKANSFQFHYYKVEGADHFLSKYTRGSAAKEVDIVVRSVVQTASVWDTSAVGLLMS